MPSLATAQAAQTTGSASRAAPVSQQAGYQDRPQGVKPFCQAAKVGHRLVGSYAPGLAATQQAAVGPVTLTASGGYVRRWILETIFTGGTGSAAVYQPDAPFNFYSLVTVTEPNNNPILNLTGYNLRLADIYGGFAEGVSPASDPDYSVATTGNIQMWPYVPVELDPTALGALSDLSSSSGYQLYLLPAPSGTLWSTLPTTVPTSVACNVYAEYWTQPEKQDGGGQPQAIVPPRTGTIQMWNQILNVVLSAGGGNQEMQLNRMGNQLRTIIMVTRSSGARQASPTAVFPNPARLEWDDIILKGVSPYIIRKYMMEMVDAVASPDNGVFALFFNQGISRMVGGNGASSWLPTVTDTRFALSGQFPSATSPTLDWIINDVSRAPLGAVERTTVGPSGPGYHPPMPQGATQ